MPPADYGKLKLPRSIANLVLLKDHLGSYARDYTAQFVLVTVLPTFSCGLSYSGDNLHAITCRSCFQCVRGLVPEVICLFLATWFEFGILVLFLLRLIHVPIQIAKRKEKLLNYMLFLRITPTLPNLFINLSSPIVDIPFHIFFLAAFDGLIPATYITVRSGLAFGEISSVTDLYYLKMLFLLFLIGSVIIYPTLLERKQIYERKLWLEGPDFIREIFYHAIAKRECLFVNVGSLKACFTRYVLRMCKVLMDWTLLYACVMMVIYVKLYLQLYSKAQRSC